jgi:hypothetical protein
VALHVASKLNGEHRNNAPSPGENERAHAAADGL